METPFVYDRYVTGKTFVGRKTDCNILGNLLEAGEHVVIYSPPKTGKMSVVQQTLFTMRTAGRQFAVVRVNMFNVRTLEQFLLKFGTEVLKPFCPTPQDCAAAIGKYLPDTHFVFDAARYASCEEVVSLNWEADRNDIAHMLALPGRLALERGLPYYVILEDFHNIMMDDRYEDVFFEMEKVIASRDRSERNAASFIMLGSRVNAMKYIFEEKKYFYRLVERFPLQKVDDRDIIEHVVRGFLATGKVIERELVLGVCGLFRGQMWYINHFTSICDTMTRGYLNEGILMDALKVLISIHEPRFTSMVDGLTDHQLSLLQAILDGVVKFSSSDVIEKYSLNSSANVRRVKDALRKKEIITFNEKDEPVILDPLFEYWIGRFFFERQ